MKYRHIVAALGHLESDGRTISTVRDITDSKETEVTFVHAIKQMSMDGLSYSLPSVADQEKLAVRNAENALSKMVFKQDHELCQATVTVGSAKHAILEQAQKVHADLIVVHQHRRRFRRSVAESLLPSAPCDILVVHSD